MTQVTVAATQMACTWDRAANIAGAESLVREAAANGAQIVLIQELFETPYFCKDQKKEHFDLAHPVKGHPVLARMSALAAELKVVLPVSFFERAHNAYYNSLVVLDADGANLGLYRKSHIPDGPGYQEKYYFRPGDTGFKAWKTKYGTIGVGICWDQWYPEAARAMVLEGAEVLLYPTAIGSEPYDESLDTRQRWQRAMQGHAVANAVPIVAANRIGVEDNDGVSQRYYGHSFIADHTGEIIAELGEADEGVIVARFDLDAIAAYRADWGFFRDRRTDLYGKHLL